MPFKIKFIHTVRQAAPLKISVLFHIQNLNFHIIGQINFYINFVKSIILRDRQMLLSGTFS